MRVARRYYKFWANWQDLLDCPPNCESVDNLKPLAQAPVEIRYVSGTTSM